MPPHRVRAMLLYALPVVALSLWEQAFQAQPNPGPRDLQTKDYFVVEIGTPQSLESFGYTLEEPFPIENHWLVSHPKTERSGLHKRNFQSANARNFYNSPKSNLKKKSVVDLDEIKTEFNISDPLFDQQWHIVNQAEVGHDMNILPVWRKNITGKNVTVAIVDDGIDFTHPDFKDSFCLEGSWDYNLHQQSPKPLLNDDNHGTRCAGEVAANKNGFCGVGIAYDSKVSGIRILSGDLTKADEARALIHRYNINDIYSCSWGPEDNGMEIDGPSSIVRRAELDGIENGRNGKGSIYVVASGNGDYFGDNCNFDGYTNSIYSITVSAIDRLNQHPFYAESCSANMIVTYSSNQKDKITTSDRIDPLNPNDIKCTNKHSGTSAAAPIAAGVFALVLEARPDLTWRDLQYLCRDTAVKFDIVPNDKSTGPANRVTNDWQITADGHHYHNSYGYGLLDADAIVKRSIDWQLVKPQSFYFLPMQILNTPINHNTIITQEVSKEQWEEANMDRLEHVRVRISYRHDQRGALHFSLKSPAGVVSDLATPRKRDLSNMPVHDWEFLTVVHWNETGLGTWKLAVQGPDELRGEVTGFQLKFFGESRDPSKVKRYSEVWNDYEEQAEVVMDPVSESDAMKSESTPTTTSETSETTTGESTQSETTTTEETGDSPSPTEFEQPPVQMDTHLPEPTNHDSTETSGIEVSVPHSHVFKTHSLGYYLLVSVLGVVVLASIFVPIVYCCYQRRIRRSYASLNEQNIEMDDFSDFEIEED